MGNRSVRIFMPCGYGIQAALETHFTVGLHATARPAGLVIKTFGAGAGFSAQAESPQATRRKPRQHFVVQALSMPLAFVKRVYKQRPDIAGVAVADGTPDDLPLHLGHPTPTSSLHRVDHLVIADDAGGEPVFMDAMANPLNGGDIVPTGLS